jgi:chromosome segregation ATPase
VSRVEAEGAVALASARQEAKGLAQRIALLEGELAEAQWARETAKENFWGLSDAVANAERRREELEREFQKRVEELTLLQT